MFSNISSSLEIDSLQWKKWFNEEKAEVADLPKAYKEIQRFHRLLLLRAMRPDRLTSALATFIGESMGEEYVQQQPFQVVEMYKETSATTPVFFVLFPGVDPTPEVELIAKMNDVMLTNISMGQGQELIAKNALFAAAKDGNWILL